MFPKNLATNTDTSEPTNPFAGWTEIELLNARNAIDELLPPQALSDLDLNAEIIMQYRTAKALQADMMQDTTAEPNKVATVVNACSATLQALVKMQNDLHTSERLKEIEMRLIKVLNKMPPEMTEEFFKWYLSDDI